MTESTFKSLFCERFSIPESRYAAEIFRRCAYPQARILRGVTEFISPLFFSGDYELIREVGLCASFGEVRATLISHPWHHTNTWFSRRRLRIRLSTSKLRLLAIEIFEKAEQQAA